MDYSKKADVSNIVPEGGMAGVSTVAMRQIVFAAEHSFNKDQLEYLGREFTRLSRKSGKGEGANNG